MSTKPPSREVPRTLADVLACLEAQEEMTYQRRQDLASAVRRIATLLGQHPRDILANVEDLRRCLAPFTASSAGMSPRRWNNVRALLTSALALAGVKILRQRRRMTLSTEWLTLLLLVVDRYERARLSRFFSYCSANGIAPDQVSNAVVQQFAMGLQQDSLVERPTQVHRELCLAWTRCSATLPGWPPVKLAVPYLRRDYALPVTAYPASFAADLQGYLTHIAGDDLFSETALKPSNALTVHNTRQRILQLAAALVLSGQEAGAIKSLADIVLPQNVKTALAFLWKRNGQRKTGQLHNFCLLVIKIAKHWVKLPVEHLDTLRSVRRTMDPGSTGMTERNRARLRQFDDPENVQRLINLPSTLLREIAGKSQVSYDQAVQMQSAVAVAILLVAPMRVKNLAGLTLDRHLVQTRAGGVWHLVIPGAEVKNKAALEFEIPSSVHAVLDVYLNRCRPLLATEASAFLFPARQGGAKPPAQMTQQVKRTIALKTGIDLNVHAFRHLAAKLFLTRHPGEYETVRLLLAHKSLKTTVSAYCGLEQTDAMRRFDTLMDDFRTDGGRTRAR